MGHCGQSEKTVRLGGIQGRSWKMTNHPNRSTKRVRLTKKSGPLHIEAPGCIINISPGLADAEGRSIVHISVSADGDRYSGDPEWWIDGEPGRDEWACRVIRTGEPG